MADDQNKGTKAPPVTSGPKKSVPSGGRMDDIQRRAQQMAKRKPTDPSTFFREAWVELKKTSWPNRNVLIKSTTVVLALVVAVAIWVGGLDAILSQVMNPLFHSSVTPGH